MFLSAFAIVAVPAWHIWHHTTGYEWYAAGIVTVAEAKVGIGYRKDAMQEVRMADGRTVVMSVREIARSPKARAVRDRLKDEVFASAFLGAKASAVVIVLFLALFWYRGWQLHRGRRVRGAELATAGQLRRRVQSIPAHLRQALSGRPGPYRIAGVPFPERHRDPAHNRLGHHRLRQDGADLRPRLPDPRARRALCDLRQDGELHPGRSSTPTATC